MTCGVLYDYDAGKSVAIESIEYYDKKFLSFITSAPLYPDDPNETTYYQCECFTSVRTGRMYVRVYNKRANSSRLRPGLMINLYTEDNGGFVHFDSKPTVIAEGASISCLTQSLSTVEGSITISNNTRCVIVMQTAVRLTHLIALDEDGAVWMIDMTMYRVENDKDGVAEARLIDMITRKGCSFDSIIIENPYSVNCSGTLTLIPKDAKYPNARYTTTDGEDNVSFVVKDVCLKNEYFHAHIMDEKSHIDFIYGKLEIISSRQFRAYDCEIMGSWGIVPRSRPAVIRIKMGDDKDVIIVWVDMKPERSLCL